MEYIALDVHKRYTWAPVENAHGDRVTERRVLHQRGAIQAFMQQWTAGSPVGVEIVGNWYWVVDEIETRGGQSQLVNARLAKLMIGRVNKSDKLDAQGLNRPQRTGTLPTVWIPSAAVRDARKRPRTRMLVSHQRTQLKNRVLATVAKYGLGVDGVSDAFGKRGRQILTTLVLQLPPQSPQAVTCLLTQLDQVEATLTRLEGQMRAVFAPCLRDGLAQDAAWRGRSPGHRHLDGDGHGGAFSSRRGVGQLQRFGGTGTLQWGQVPLWRHPPRCESVSEVGLWGSREQCRVELRPVWVHAHQPALRPPSRASGAGQSKGGRRPTPGGSKFLDVDQGRALSGPDVVHTTVSALC